jgi:hypothetical protein
LCLISSKAAAAPMIAPPANADKTVISAIYLSLDLNTQNRLDQPTVKEYCVMDSETFC